MISGIDHFLDKPGKNPRAGVDPKDLYTNAPEGRTYSSEDSNPQLYLHEQQNQLQQAFGPVTYYYRKINTFL